MPDYKFTFTKTTELFVEAQTEQEAWVQAMTVNADLIPLDWEVKLSENQDLNNNGNLAQGPIEVDDWGDGML